MTKKIITDNVLHPVVFKKIQDYMLSTDYRWYFAAGVVNLENTENFQFIHQIHEGPFVDAPDDYQLVYPLLEIIRPQAIIKIKANLLTQTPENSVHGLHTDVIVPGALTAIFYLNTNNGYTLFDDGDKVESIENRLVIFPANIPHSGASCTDEQRRVVINLNYIPWRDDKHWHALIDEQDITYRNHWESKMTEVNKLPYDKDGVPVK
tara:strand:- start:16 stop:636 length:621 start_codon:yes stop_codon:yes gene_type:complete